MMGNDMSPEREHGVCLFVCERVRPGSMTTQWLTLSLIELIHRTLHAPIIIYIYCTNMSQLESLLISVFLSLSIYLS